MTALPPLAPHDYWQQLVEGREDAKETRFDKSYPVWLSGGRQLLLPIRALPDGQHGLASLIINQASFAVVAALADEVASRLIPFAPDIVVGLPTLGLTLASAVAERLGHARYVPFGTSRKFWYDEALSVPLSSITTPEQSKRLYVDPRLVPLLEGKRVALIDDVISSGKSIVAGLKLLETLAISPVVVGAAMLQTVRWHNPVAAQWGGEVVAAFTTPLLERAANGLWLVA
ncbi:phosphoribosyltransferase [Devosia sp.]|uniref:phosphoribosyltransferase n=1 Tax=Devosia sp. TaxID=1871048 RepID=UPI003BABA444